MKSFNNFVVNKMVQEFHSYVESEYRANPEAFEMFMRVQPRLAEANQQLINELWPWSKKKQAPAQDLNWPPQQQQQQQQQQPAPQQPAPQQQQQQPPARQQPAPAQKSTPQDNATLPMGAEVPDENASKTVGTAIKAFTDKLVNISRKSQNAQQVKAAVDGFHSQWVAFKKQMVGDKKTGAPGILNFQQVQNPQNHGMTYPLAPGQ